MHKVEYKNSKNSNSLRAATKQSRKRSVQISENLTIKQNIISTILYVCCVIIGRKHNNLSIRTLCVIQVQFDCSFLVHFFIHTHFPQLVVQLEWFAL